MWRRMNRHQRMAFELRMDQSSESPCFIDLGAWTKYREECIKNKQLAWADLAFAWCRLIHAEMKNGKTLPQAVEATFFDVAAYFGAEGDVCSSMWHSMLGALEACWVHGKDLYDWHRQKYCK